MKQIGSNCRQMNYTYQTRLIIEADEIKLLWEANKDDEFPSKATKTYVIIVQFTEVAGFWCNLTHYTSHQKWLQNKVFFQRLILGKNQSF